MRIGRLTKSAGDVFTVTAKGEDINRQGRQPWVQVLDRGDGSYIVRYKLFSSLRNFEISITYKGKHVQNSPYQFPGKSANTPIIVITTP